MLEEGKPHSATTKPPVCYYLQHYHPESTSSREQVPYPSEIQHGSQHTLSLLISQLHTSRRIL